MNCPGGAILLDWRSSRVLVFYRLFCLIVDSVALILSLSKAAVRSTIRFFRPRAPKSLQGELALVTGSGHGIGMELCVQLGRLGASVICLDINEEANKETEARLKDMGCQHYMFQCDVSDAHHLDLVSAVILEKIGCPSLIINNAAITKKKTFLEHSQEELRTLFKTNVVAPMLITQKFLPSMLSEPSRKHQIVGISSIVGMLGTPNMVPYSSTKFALTGFMEGLHYELMVDKVKNIVLTTVHPFLVAHPDHTKPTLRYQGLIGIQNIEEAVKQIVLGIRREEKEVYIPSSLYIITRILRIIPREAQTKLLEFFEFGSGP